MFNHVDLNLPHLSRENIDGVRYYSVPLEEELIKLVSITSVTSHKNRQIFINWRKKVGEHKQIKLQGSPQVVELTCTLSPSAT